MPVKVVFTYFPFTSYFLLDLILSMRSYVLGAWMTGFSFRGPSRVLFSGREHFPWAIPGVLIMAFLCLCLVQHVLPCLGHHHGHGQSGCPRPVLRPCHRSFGSGNCLRGTRQNCQGKGGIVGGDSAGSGRAFAGDQQETPPLGAEMVAVGPDVEEDHQGVQTAVEGAQGQRYQPEAVGGRADPEGGRQRVYQQKCDVKPII